MAKATLRQKLALDEIVANGGNVTKAMRKAGYSEATANTPSKLTDSIGFQELMEESGLTDNLLIDALVEDIKGKPKRRFKELELGFKVRNRLNENVPQVNKTLIVLISGESNSRYATQPLSSPDSN